MQPTRRRGGGRSRILYWFRTPPGVKVGRGPLDEEAIRTLEAGHPDLEFDWTRILKGQAEGADERPDAHGRRDGERRAERRDRRQQPRGHDRRTPEPAEAPESIVASAPAEVAPTSAAHARLGSEGLARLRARHSEIIARIEERVPDSAEQERLKAIAERLNPDAWVTDADVSAGLDAYEPTFAELRTTIGPRRKAEVPYGESGPV